MIALDHKLPDNCAGCPCFSHIHACNGESLEKTLLLKVCMASSRVIDSIKWKEGDPMPGDEWYDFTKPEWCPWIDNFEAHIGG